MYTPMLSVPADRPAPISVTVPKAPAAAATAAPDDAVIAQTAAREAYAPASPHLFGLATDLGLPDGANLGLVVRPASWIRLHGAGGTNSANVGFRGGVTAIPFWLWHFGPSLTIEAGFCRMGAVNSVVRTFFQVPSWMKDYAQQAGYSYYNAHLGLEFGRRNVTGFIHIGGSYVNATVHAPKPVSIPPANPNSTDEPAQLVLRQDATVRAYTISAKVGFIVFFGGL
jgi:hypothetical protein